MPGGVRVDDAPPGDAAGGLRAGRGLEKAAAHQGVDAVGADQDVALYPGAVGERGRDLPRVLFDVDDPAAQPQLAPDPGARSRPAKVGPVRVVVGRAEVLR